ncbi:MAG TPA: aminomethyltransferase family protein [Pyrinomonadaceae bacterium]|nr:aminomethyltransferase family protein [Pyrinomonadaceae bacterium]
MTEAAEQVAIQKLLLDKTHQQLGASMIERDGWSVPASYGDVAQEYETVREGGAGLVDLSSRGRLLVTGSEAVQFLNGLITNDMKTLEGGSWMPAAFPNVQGRLIASVRVIRLQDEGTDTKVSPTFLIDTEAATHETVLKTLERFTLAGDFRVIDQTSATVMLSVQGKKAASVVGSVGEAAAVPEPRAVRQLSWQHAGSTIDVTVIHASHTGEDGFDLSVDADHASSLWTALRQAGAQPVGYDALEILRIEAGMPRYGSDMDDTNVVTETNLDEAVSYTKGCYVGQEIIARIKYRGHVAKKLSGLIFDGAIAVEAGAVVNSVEGKEIGRITSVTNSPRLKRTIALAYLKYDYIAPGTPVKVLANHQELPGEVVELPFVRS